MPSLKSETGRIRFRRVGEFLGESSVSSSQPIICVRANSPSFSQPKNSVSSLFRNSALETVFRPFPAKHFLILCQSQGSLHHLRIFCLDGRNCAIVITESLARVIIAIRINWRSLAVLYPPKNRLCVRCTAIRIARLAFLGVVHSLRICPYLMVWPLLRPGSRSPSENRKP